MSKWKKVLFPHKRWHFARVAVIIILAVTFFRYLAIPIRTAGKSMEDTVQDGKLLLGWRIPHLLQGDKLNYGDIVLVKFHQDSVMLLKRVVGLPGDKISFKNGKLVRNDKVVEESYIKGPCSWNLAERLVKPGNAYVVGDNRSVVLEAHVFGQVSQKRVKGVRLWP